MRFWSWHRRARDCPQRRLVVAVALAAYLVATMGIPLPAYVNKEDGIPFPCQHHACGCATGRQCWESCCCYTPRQKLAWAYANHVQPPASLVAEVAAAEMHDASHGAMHAAELPAHCCAQRRASATALAHRQHHDEHAAASCHKHDAHSGGVTLVIGALARQCRGMVEVWCASGACLPPPAAIDWQFQWDLVEWVALAGHTLPIGNLSPPVPPPRV
ncbi:MAG: hypothetical protein HY288_08710 [Planctomycetia bacterium]|nr:hypothetical protein [Planctomycetia bacterium]